MARPGQFPPPLPSRLVLLEVSKVRYQHSTFLDGLIRAWASKSLSGRHGPLKLLAHDSLFANLSPESRAAVDYAPIPVMDTERRRLVRKSLLEAWVVLRRLAALGPDDVLLVTTILPSAMVLVELGARLFPHKRLVVFQHGELEGALEGGKKGLGSFGVYMRLWLRLRREGSKTGVATPDTFIASGLRAAFPESIDEARLFAIPIPMIAAGEARERGQGPPRICFIGFDTPNKGFAIFESLVGKFPAYEFRAIGGGRNRSLSDGSETPIGDNEDFLAVLGGCDVAVFPYTAGYRLALSAAATDAIAAGLHLLATDLPCFRALAGALGPETVTICRDAGEIEARLGDSEWLHARMAARAKRLKRIEKSPYGLPAVGAAIETMMAGMEQGR